MTEIQFWQATFTAVGIVFAVVFITWYAGRDKDD